MAVLMKLPLARCRVPEMVSVCIEEGGRCQRHHYRYCYCYRTIRGLAAGIYNMYTPITRVPLDVPREFDSSTGKESFCVNVSAVFLPVVVLLLRANIGYCVVFVA